MTGPGGTPPAGPGGPLAGAAGPLPLTPSQTVGPFFAIGLTWPDGHLVVPVDDPKGVWLRGEVRDGEGRPVPDALVETWQAGPDGHFDHPDDPDRPGDPARAARPDGSGRDGWPSGARGGRPTGFGRCGTDADGRYAIRTRKPGPVPAPDGRLQAPHIDVCVLARGLLDRLVTRVYFADERDANAVDPLLCSLEPGRRDRLVAGRTGDGYRFDIHLRGPDECVFFRL